ncbi:MAG TPA: hypothetical protein VMT27_09435 [Actinomycetes bacterium]|nr:hypothetical protein [Actinomycetes bacterium]
MKHITVALATVALELVAAPALATSPHTVDPAGMTPTLNPDYAPWTCVLAGTGITCTGYEDFSYTNEGTDFQCNGQVAYVTGTQRSKFVRWHDLEGRALKTSIQINFTADRLTLSPTGAGAAVFLSGDWHKHYVYPVPGDLTQRVLTETGSAEKLRVPGRGVTYRDSGTVTYVPSQEYETPSGMHGVHDRFSGADLEALICDGLT